MLNNNVIFSLIVVVSVVGFVIYLIGTLWLLGKSFEAEEEVKDTKLGKWINKSWVFYFIFVGVLTVSQFIKKDFEYQALLGNIFFIIVVLLPIIIQQKIKK